MHKESAEKSVSTAQGTQGRGVYIFFARRGILSRYKLSLLVFLVLNAFRVKVRVSSVEWLSTQCTVKLVWEES